MNQKQLDITIRRAEPDDYEAIWAILNDPKVIWGTLQLPYTAKETRRQRMEKNTDDRINLLALVQNEPVGQLSLAMQTRPRRKHVGDIGMAVRDAWQGQGIGTALMAAAVDLADRWLNLLRLELDVYTDNEPSNHINKFDSASQTFSRLFDQDRRCAAQN